MLRDGNVVHSHPVDYEARCVAIHPGQAEVAVGGETVRVRRGVTCLDTFLNRRPSGSKHNSLQTCYLGDLKSYNVDSFRRFARYLRIKRPTKIGKKAKFLDERKIDGV